NQKAEAQCREAIRLHPDDLKLHLNLADVLRDQKKWDEAIAAYSRVIELNPAGWEAWYARAGLYAQQHKAEKVRSDLAGLMKLRIDPGAQNNIAWRLATDPDPSWRNPAIAV